MSSPCRGFCNSARPMPDRVLRAIDNATIDHRGPDFGQSRHGDPHHLGRADQGPGGDLSRIRHRAWEAALTNTLSPGDAQH